MKPILPFRTIIRLACGIQLIFQFIAGGTTAPIIDDEDWQAMGSLAGVDSRVFAITSWKNTLYVAGILKYCGSDTTNNIAQWDGTRWSRLGSGLRGKVNALAVDSLGNLYASAALDTTGNQLGRGVSKWDGKEWISLGGRTNGNVLCLVFDAEKGILYAGGDFDTICGIDASGIAQWNGTAWEPFDTVPYAANISVTALELGPEGVLYAGMGGVVWKWDGSNWVALGAGTFHFPEKAWDYNYDEITGIAFNKHNGRLYATGMDSFDSSSSDVNITGRYYIGYALQWDGTSWSRIGTCNGKSKLYPSKGRKTSCLTLDHSGNLYISGSFSTSNGCCMDYSSKFNIIKWDGNKFTNIDASSARDIQTMYTDHNDRLFIGGFIHNLDTTIAKGVAEYRDGRYISFGKSRSGIPISDLAFDNKGVLWANRLYMVRGSTDYSDRTSRFDGSVWREDEITPIVKNGMVVFLKDTIGSGIYNLLYRIKAFAEGKDGELYAGGYFDSVNALRKWDGKEWTLITGIPKYGQVYSLAFDNDNNLYVGGQGLMEIWDGKKMITVSTDISNEGITLLRYDNVRGIMYCVKSSNNSSVRFSRVCICEYDSIRPVSPLIKGYIQAMVCDDEGNLYIGGTFDSIGMIECNNIARWDGEVWSDMGSGTDRQYIDMDDNQGVFGLALRDTILYVGGVFLRAGGAVSPYFANVNIRGTGNTLTKRNKLRHVNTSPGLLRRGDLLVLTNSIPDDRIVLYSISGRRLRKSANNSVLLTGLAPQMIFVEVLRKGAVVNRCNMLIR